MKFRSDLLRAARAERGWSRFEVAKRADVSIDSVRRAETGAHEPGSMTLARIARVLGLSLDALFVGHDGSDGDTGAAAASPPLAEAVG
jgi:putative transcriptional regulator